MIRLERITMQGFKSFAGKITIPFPRGFNCVCGPNGSGKSCRRDTQVLLSTGAMATIGEIVEDNFQKSKNIIELDDGFCSFENPQNMKVLGLDTDKMKVVEKDVAAFIKRRGEERLYKIITKTGREVVTTACHPVMVFKEGKIVSEVVGNLNVSDFIATPRSLRLPVDGYLKFEGIEVDEDFARLVGYLVGDGYIAENRIEIINQDNEILDDFRRLVKSVFNKDIQYDKKSKRNGIEGNATRLICWDKGMPVFFRKLFGTDALRVTGLYKTVPKEIMISKDSVIGNFLGALFDCDATVRKNNPTFEYVTKNEKLARQVQILLLRLGIISRINLRQKMASNTRKKEKRPYYYVTVEGKEKLKLLMESIPMKCVHKTERLKSASVKSVIPNENIDLLPEKVNELVRKCVKLLGIEYKNLRKEHPYFAAYIENRCCPTRNGMEKSLKILDQRLEFFKEKCQKMVEDQKELIMILREMKLRRNDASKSIGLSPTTINAHWAQKVKARQKNIRKLFDFVRINLGQRIEEAENILEVLKNLSDSDIFWDRIAKIEEVPGEEWVYDLSIPNCHNFIGNGIFVHNSNIIDALMFVLGTSSARSIRAQRLQNLIFNGARDKKPADFCEVTLYMENDGSIPGYEKEIKIMRRVNRSGITFYKLNGRTVTRSKILDLLANANLSPEGYNIIMQGDVTKIIEMNPRERRGVIDEISGIAEFDDKKDKAQRELERVELRVRENMIVVAEKQKLVARLKQEKENAQAYKRLFDELRRSKASLLRTRMKDIEQKLSLSEKEDAESEKQFSGIDKELKKIEKEMSDSEELSKKIGDEVLKKSRNIDIMRKIDSLQTEIIRRRDKIDFNERQAAVLRASAVERNQAVKEILERGFGGVHGTFSSLVSTEKRYEVALEVATGRHDKDLVVDDEDIASACIRHLKRSRIGRARFLPLRKLRGRERREYKGKEKIIGYMIDFAKYDRKFSPAVQHVLGSTLVVENIDAAKRISGFRVVTLDGDLVEPSGEMIGGYYKRKQKEGAHVAEIKKLEEESAALEREIAKMESDLKLLKSKEQTESGEVLALQKRREEAEKNAEEMRKKWKEALEQKIALQSGLSKGKIERARLEASYDNLRAEAEEFQDVSQFYEKSVDELQERVRSLTLEINKLGPVNLKALEEYDIIITEFEELKKKLDKLINEKEAVLKVVEEVSKRRHEKFMETFAEINKNLTKIYQDLAGGTAGLRLEEESNIDSGMVIEASPPGKKVLNLDSMSGGERTLTSLAFLFAIMQHYSSPFYVLDEIDAALDKANTKKISNLIKKYSDKVQFIVITHNDLTIGEADKVFGVSIEGGVSKVFGIEMPQEAATPATE